MDRPRSLTVLLLAVPALALPLAAQHREHAPADEAPGLFTDLGDHHYAITTAVPEAQAWFDQGLRLYYAFNHPEAVRSFREAQRRDPACAMCWWGEALTWGPNINMPMDSAGGVAAFAALQEARRLASGASARERALIDALAERYAAVPPAERGALDSAYSGALAGLVERFPDDHEIRVLYGESVMDLQPWDYWTEQTTLRPGMDVALAGLERVLAQNPRHPGACHFLIHAVEQEQPERAVPCAERLAALMPGAGHLVHMPGHIYIRVGRYADAVEANRHAVHADETYITDRRPGPGVYTLGYYPHNYDFMAFAASMIGRSDDAIRAAERVAGLIPPEMLGAPGMAFLEHWRMRPIQFLVRFHRWGAVLSYPAPAAELPHARALWHYARGRALAATGRVADAGVELAQVRALRADPALAGVRMEFNQSRDLLAVADQVLAGWIAVAEGRMADAVAALQAAVAAEDALLYGEPPEWSVPVRQELGFVLLRAERWPEAAEAFRADLHRFPDNGWSLAGLALALERQGRAREAADVRARAADVLRSADVDLRSLF